ncbi:MAG: ABC transporter ATP-binding protein [Chlorobi bacterium]|nr:ABC transporter ATP-binding protein [Chlorobiota bacterium]
MINIKNITHYYGKTAVFKDFDTNFKAETLSCLLGSSGSGKTTLLRLIAGLEIPEKGIIRVNDIIFTENTNLKVPPHKRKIGFVFQDAALWPHFTVYKNVAFPLSEKKEKNIKTKVYEILDFFGIADCGNKYPHQLSGGQKQLAAVARSIILKPDILLMDEPLSNLDVKLKKKISEYILKIKNEFNLTVIYVTHDHREAFATADEIFVLNNGKIEDSGTPEQIKKSANEYVKYFLEY